jgi:hypothetical protein
MLRRITAYSSKHARAQSLPRKTHTRVRTRAHTHTHREREREREREKTCGEKTNSSGAHEEVVSCVCLRARACVCVRKRVQEKGVC